MKKLLKIGLSIVLGAVIILAGFVAYKVGELKKVIEVEINRSNDQIRTLGLSFDPFKCSGLFSIECKSKKVRFGNDVVFENMAIRWKDFRLSSVVSEFETDLKIPKISEFSRDEREFLKIVGPQKIKLWGKTTKLDEGTIGTKINLNVQAQNLDYSFKSDFDIHAPSFVKEIPIGFLDSQKFSDWMMKSDNDIMNMLKDIDIEKFKVVVHDGMELTIKAKDFQPAVLSYLKNNEYEFKNLNDDEIKAKIAREYKMIKRNISISSSLASEAFEAILGLILDDGEKIVARLNKTINLTRETDFSSLLGEFERSVSIQAY